MRSAKGTMWVVETVVPNLVATDQKHGAAAGIERVEDSIGLPTVLNPQFTHVGVFRAVDF